MLTSIHPLKPKSSSRLWIDFQSPANALSFAGGFELQLGNGFGAAVAGK